MSPPVESPVSLSVRETPARSVRAERPLRRAGPIRSIHVLELRSVRGTGGGPEKTILMGAASADPVSLRTTVCYLADRRDEVFGIGRWAHELGLDYVEIRERHSFDWTIWAELRRLVRARGIDIVHAHDYKTNLLALLLDRAESVVPLSTVHGWTGHTRRETTLYYPVDKRLLARFPRLIAVSGQIRDELVRCGAKPEHITTVLNGIDHHAFRRNRRRGAETRAALEIPPHAIVLGAVGRLEPQKRFDLLLEGFARLRQRYPNLHLMIVGDGSSRERLQRLAKQAGLGNECRFMGHWTNVAELHHAFDVFVQSSDYEGTPNSVLEAMALETPIVATDAGGTRELVRHGVDGLIVPCGDVPALMRAVEMVLNDPAAALSRAATARRRIERELSFEARTNRVEAIYRELVEPRGARSAA